MTKYMYHYAILDQDVFTIYCIDELMIFPVLKPVGGKTSVFSSPQRLC